MLPLCSRSITWPGAAALAAGEATGRSRRKRTPWTSCRTSWWRSGWGRRRPRLSSESSSSKPCSWRVRSDPQSCTAECHWMSLNLNLEIHKSQSPSLFLQNQIHSKLIGRHEQERSALQDRLQMLANQNKALQSQLSEMKRKQAESDCKVWMERRREEGKKWMKRGVA